MGYLEDIQNWVKRIRIDPNIIKEKELLLILNEAFANSLNASPSEKTQITIVLREELTPIRILEIIVSDPGKGFQINGNYGSFPSKCIGQKYPVVEHQGLSVFCNLESEDQISFFLQPNSLEKELSENGRGLISILKLAKQVKYIYSNCSYNYLFVRID